MSALGVSQHTAFRLQQQYPHKDVALLASEARALASALGVVVEDACVLAAREPALLRLPSGQVKATFEVLCTILEPGVGSSLSGPQQGPQLGLRDARAAATLAATTWPALLTSGPDVLASAHQRLVNELPAAPADVALLAAQQPFVLTAPLEQMRASLGAVAGALGVPLVSALRLLTAYPSLLKEATADLVARVGALALLLRMPQEDVVAAVVAQPSLLVADVEVTAARVQGLADLLQADTQVGGPGRSKGGRIGGTWCRSGSLLGHVWLVGGGLL